MHVRPVYISLYLGQGKFLICWYRCEVYLYIIWRPKESFYTGRRDRQLKVTLDHYLYFVHS